MDVYFFSCLLSNVSHDSMELVLLTFDHKYPMPARQFSNSQIHGVKDKKNKAKEKSYMCFREAPKQIHFSQFMAFPNGKKKGKIAEHIKSIYET